MLSLFVGVVIGVVVVWSESSNRWLGTSAGAAHLPLLVLCIVYVHHRPEVLSVVEEQLLSRTDLASCIHSHPFVSCFRAGVGPIVRCKPHIRPEIRSFGVIDVPTLKVFWIFSVKVKVPMHLQAVMSPAFVTFCFGDRLAAIPGNKFSRACVF